MGWGCVLFRAQDQLLVRAVEMGRQENIEHALACVVAHDLAARDSMT